jgi:hypothetical protein
LGNHIAHAVTGDQIKECEPFFTPGERQFVREVFPHFFDIELRNWNNATETQKGIKIYNGQFGRYKLSLLGTCWG